MLEHAKLHKIIHLAARLGTFTVDKGFLPMKMLLVGGQLGLCIILDPHTTRKLAHGFFQSHTALVKSIYLTESHRRPEMPERNVSNRPANEESSVAQVTPRKPSNHLKIFVSEANKNMKSTDPVFDFARKAWPNPVKILLSY